MSDRCGPRRPDLREDKPLKCAECFAAQGLTTRMTLCWRSWPSRRQRTPGEEESLYRELVRRFPAETQICGRAGQVARHGAGKTARRRAILLGRGQGRAAAGKGPGPIISSCAVICWKDKAAEALQVVASRRGHR